jgi:hypothetical protein
MNLFGGYCVTDLSNEIVIVLTGGREEFRHSPLAKSLGFFCSPGDLLYAETGAPKGAARP